MRTRYLPALFAGILLFFPSAVHAQRRDAQARSMVRQALEDYQNLEVDSALNRLRLAQNLCGQNNCSPSMQARIHIALGVVAIGGQNDTVTGVNEFVEALRLDPDAEPDQLLVTPEITAAMEQARQRVGGGASTGSTSGRTPTGRTPAGGNTLLHTPAPEQLENTPLPVYVETGSLQPARVVVHYRGLGMAGYSDQPLSRIANGYGGEIPCGQVIQPYVEYYVTAHDDSGNVIASVGSADAPTRVSIVTSRSHPAPALPGRMPPERCAEDCPPGMSGPQCRSGGSSSGRGQRQLGDPCETNEQCAEGLHCEGGACAAGEASAPSAPSNKYVFAIDLGGGAGIAFIGGTTNADPDLTTRPDLIFAEWNREDQVCEENFYCPRSVSPGAVAAGYGYAGLRVFPFSSGVMSRLGFGASVRYQFDASQRGTLSHFFFAGRAYFALTPAGWTRNGPVVAAFLGSGVGQMQARPLPPRSMPNANMAHIISGLNNVHAGVRMEYGFGNIGHVGADVALNIQVPNFMFVIDAQAVLGLHF